MSYITMNGQTFSEIEDAVRKAKADKADSAEVDIYAENGDYVETQEITSEDDYVFFAYAVFRDCEEEPERWEWYNGTEVCYNTEAEARGVVNKAAPGKYRITAVTQTISEYVSDTDIETIVVV